MRLRYNLLETTLGASLSDSATSVTFATKLTAADGDIPTISGGDYLPLTIGNEIVYLTEYTSAATTGTISRGEEGTTAAAHDSGDAVQHNPTTQDFGGVIAYKSYDPEAVQTPGTTSSSFADVDATNLVVTFIAPPSGKVLVHQLAIGGVSGGSSGILHWNLRDENGDVAGSERRVLNNGTNSTFQLGVASETAITGLTPGTEYTYKWGHARAGGTGTCQTIYGGGLGAAVMTVLAAP